ncbi:MAG: FAD-binding oxidoreductase [Reyranella sp.]|uniref:NAD(P)/FAD-dependent oxidoreductase n=1 Tax=Reyranella sp. TaxID=1929291 RepID=UPI001AC3A961|nr:FAD-dependent oxidoreductase [Reyranella sp.]MBN9089905.1 FAD-binding oxidoreductase [Reyranella sp.]
MKRIVICGGGAIGVAIAYFLSRRGAKAIVVERHEVAGSASGKSGGFLALDWCRGSPVDRLARRSFALHAELAEQLGNPWGYRRLETYSGWAIANQAAGGASRPWLSDDVAITGQIGSPQTTALVEPRAFTRGLMRAAEAQGAELRIGTVAGLVRSAGGAVEGVALDDGETVDADAVVIAMGPWSILATRWLPLPAVYGFKGHSLVFDARGQAPAEALFLEYQEASGEVLAPEVFARADGTVWACAISSTGALPIDPAQVAPDDGAPARLEALCRRLSPVLAAAPVVARQACFRPVAEDGVPLIGRVPGVDGAYVATAHSVWGMLNAPATGEAMAELILDGGASHVDLTAFAPDRLKTFDPARLHGV